ncbi:unnamed protein product, partial [marine sediment metagenome]
MLQQKLKDQDKAFSDAFNKSQPLKRIPVFKRKGFGDSIRFTLDFKIDNRRMFLSKLGWIGFYKSCPINGKVKNITISKKGEKWYASIQVEQMVEIGKHPSSFEIGI